MRPRRRRAADARRAPSCSEAPASDMWPFPSEFLPGNQHVAFPPCPGDLNAALGGGAGLKGRRGPSIPGEATGSERELRGCAARRAPEEPPVPAPAPLRWRGQIAAKRFEVQITVFPSGSELILTQSKQPGLGWRQELDQGCGTQWGAAGRGAQPSTPLSLSLRGCTEGTGTEVHSALRTSLAAPGELSPGGMQRRGRQRKTLEAGRAI